MQSSARRPSFICDLQREEEEEEEDEANVAVGSDRGDDNSARCLNLIVSETIVSLSFSQLK